VPTYQYACTVCSHELEAVQSFSDDPLTVCPECAGRLRKVFSAVGVVFKGSGFYRTDSRAGNHGSGGDGSGGANGSNGSNGSAKSTSSSGSSDTGGSAKSGGGGAKSAPATAS
jgi:putative FmdB family regulatory protein